MSKETIAKILHWLGGPISVAVGWLATWLYTEIPGLTIFGSADTIAKAIAGVVVFAVSSGLTWLSHDKLFSWILEELEASKLVQPKPIGPENSTLYPTS